MPWALGLSQREFDYKVDYTLAEYTHKGAQPHYDRYPHCGM